MNTRDGLSAWHCLLLAYTTVVLLGLAAATCAAQPAPAQRLRIVGGLAGVSQFTRHEERFWTRDLTRLSGGKYGASIVAFDQAGVPGQEMLNLMKLGVVPFGNALLSQVSSEYPELGTPDMAGLSPDMPALRRVVAAFRPYLGDTLRERYGVELLAVYVYPAQVLFCKQPLTQLSDLAGRRTRVSGPTQADYIRALGGIPVVTEFADLMSHMNSGNTECAVTGAMSGNMLGLHRVTRSLYTLPISWGLAVFGANQETWNALPSDLKALLRSELPKLETAVWAESERETGEGVSCNTGAATCTRESRGTMTESRPSAEDRRRSKEIFAASVLAGWVARCGPTCAQVWDQTVGPVVGFKAPAVQ
ncbi:TRAP transporter substrate-binding protein [Variovorax sp. PBL-E5]|uniref:TRAP transporter substrate-binding protein n=1 Tax=Variovorax sp. PBL-E5 TaxID=434014 RepID=UPI001317BB7B|nr:TRAP transporter substrate-binding protein [Variovorax sp. PBL-E5]VTU25530.1 TRAP transporter solute receptor, DctP family [Variovorax sp. PBL-E5]